MNEISNYSDKNFPLNKKWIFVKIFIIFARMVLILAFLIPMLYIQKDLAAGGVNYFEEISAWGWLVIFLVFTYLILSVVLKIFQRLRFHFIFNTNFLEINEGIINKQQRNIPYSAIQNIFVERNILGKILGYSRLIIENAAGEGRFFDNKDIKSRSNKTETIGSCGNKIYIPGLYPQDAERLKSLLLQKIQENPAMEIGSGI